MDELDAAHAYSASDYTGTSVAIHAGFPNPAAERTGAPLSLDRLLIRHPSSTYFFRVRGHSWHRYSVFDGDLAIIDRAQDPQNGNLVIWWEESGEFVLATFTQAGRHNVWGVVTNIIHSFSESRP